MNDTTQYGFYKAQSNESYKPFEAKEFNYNKKDKNDNFCPICHYNYHSHYHRNHCNNGVPIGDGLSVLTILLGFYLLYKYFKNNKS